MCDRTPHPEKCPHAHTSHELSGIGFRTHIARAKVRYYAHVRRNPTSVQNTFMVPTQLHGIYSPSVKQKKLSQPFRLGFRSGMGELNLRRNKFLFLKKLQIEKPTFDFPTNYFLVRILDQKNNFCCCHFLVTLIFEPLYFVKIGPIFLISMLKYNEQYWSIGYKLNSMVTFEFQLSSLIRQIISIKS